MIRALAALLGLGGGALAAAWVLLSDPLSLVWGTGSRDIPGAERLVVGETLARGVAAEPAGVLGLAPEDGSPFRDGALRYARIDLAIVDSAGGGTPALGVRLSAISPDNSLAGRRLLMDSVWNLAWPDHGSLFLAGRDDYRPLLADQAWNAITGEGFRPSPRRRALTTSARLLGGGGRLTAALGSYVEYRDPGAGAELALGLENAGR
jgi:hypothetical protein